MKTRIYSPFFALSLLLMSLMAFAPSPVQAAIVGYSVRVVDTTGAPVTGATVVVNGATLTSGTVSSSVTAYSIAPTPVLQTGVSVSYIDWSTIGSGDSTGDYTIFYDSTTKGELHLVISVAKAGVSLLQSTFAVDTIGDTNVIAGAAANATTAATAATGAQTAANAAATAAAGAQTAATSNATGITSINTKIGTPTGASVSADIASVQTAEGSNGTAIAGLPTASANATAVWGAGTKTITGGTITTVADKNGYSGTATNMIADPASAIASVKSDTGGLVTSVAAVPTATATAVWGNTTRIVTGGTVAASNLPTDYQQRGTAVTLPAAPTGYGGGATAAQVAALILSNPTNPINTDSTGKVGINNFPANVLGTSDLTAIAGAVPTAAQTQAAVWGAGTKTITGGTITIVADKTGYSGAATNMIADPATAIAAVKSDTGGIVTSVAALPTASANAAAAAAAILANGNKLAPDAAGKVALTTSEHAAVQSDTQAALVAQGFSSSAVAVMFSQVAKTYGAEWGGVTKNMDGSFTITMPGTNVTVPASGAILGTVHPFYSGSVPQNTPKTVN